ncbi:MAG: PaeR7I family type II restriction endonuclease [Gemmataceae bacterium]
MNAMLEGLEQRLKDAVSFFWRTRAGRSEKQGGEDGDKDRGDRSAVTGGKHLDGFRELVALLLEEVGLKRATIYWRKKTELPGWYRAEKNWDLLVVADDKLVAIVEFKSQVGSFGNNFNNRTEEALGNASDLWAAYEEGAFRPFDRPWLGYLMLLEDAAGSNNPVKVKEPHFRVFPEFRDASYAERYNQLLTKLMRKRLYDTSLLARAIAVARTQPPEPATPPTIEAGPDDPE